MSSRPACPRSVRCAIYTRGSSSLSSIFGYVATAQSQREIAEAYVRSRAADGWSLVPIRYDEAATPGDSLDRPVLGRLLANIERGLINVVVCHALDRIYSRSPLLVTFAEHLALSDARVVATCQSFATSMIENLGRLALESRRRDIAGQRAAQLLKPFTRKEP